jgi:hypothetical protein
MVDKVSLVHCDPPNVGLWLWAMLQRVDSRQAA